MASSLNQGQANWARGTYKQGQLHEKGYYKAFHGSSEEEAPKLSRRGPLKRKILLKGRLGRDFPGRQR